MRRWTRLLLAACTSLSPLALHAQETMQQDATQDPAAGVAAAPAPDSAPAPAETAAPTEAMPATAPETASETAAEPVPAPDTTAQASAAPAPAPAADSTAAPAPAAQEEPAADSAAGMPAPAADHTATIPVAARDEPAPVSPSTAAPDKGAVQLEDVVVTATKRAKSVREIPATVIGLSGEDLERNNIKGIEDLARIVPGVNVTQPSEGTPRITIRGISSQPTTNATTGMLYGDISFTDTYLPRVVPDPLPFDLQTVEILKGPQGTLFGAGSLNGAIRYVPEPAKLGLWEMRYMAEYTRVNEGGAAPVYGAVVNAPIYGSNTAALRVTGYLRKAPGYIDNTQLGADVNTTDQKGLRGSLVIRGSERTTATLTYANQRTDLPDNAVADNNQGMLKTDNRPRHSPSDTAYQFGDLKFTADFDWAQLISDSGYVRKASDTFFDSSSRLPGNGQTPTRVSQVDYARSKTWSQELRLVSHDDPAARWQWVGGVTAWQQSVMLHLDLPVGIALPLGLDAITQALGPLAQLVPTLADDISKQGEVLLADLETHAQIREYALFGDVTRRLGDSWEVTLGGRLYRTSSGGTARQAGPLLTVINKEPVRVIDGTVEEQGFNPKASLLWHAGRDLIAYTAVSKGFRIGGVQPGYSLTSPPAPDFFKSDTLWNYEAGLRTQWFDRLLRADVTVFYDTWDNPQTFQLGAAGVSSFIDNVGAVKNKGIEGALQTVLPFGFMLNTSFCYTDTRTTKTFTTPGGDAEPGSQWAFAPKWQTASALIWMLPVASWNFTTTLNYSTIAHAPNTLDPSAIHQVFGYHQVDLQLAAANPSIPWMPEFAVTMNNLTDVRGITSDFTGGAVPGEGYRDTAYIRPRALTLHMTGRF